MSVKTPINSVGAKVPIHLEKAIKTDCPAVLVLYPPYFPQQEVTCVTLKL